MDKFSVWFFDKAFIPLLVGFLVSWFAPRYLEYFRSKREQIFKDSEALREVLENFLAATITYYSATKTKSEENLHLEPRIMWLLEEVSQYSQSLSGPLLNNDRLELNSLSFALNDAATGGTFQQRGDEIWDDGGNRIDRDVRIGECLVAVNNFRAFLLEKRNARLTGTFK